jgi:hypothetical protein
VVKDLKVVKDLTGYKISPRSATYKKQQEQINHKELTRSSPNNPYNNAKDKHEPAKRAMKNAVRNPGVDPYNSHDEQSKKWSKAWKDKARRSADKDAKDVRTSGKNAIGQSTAKKYDGNM